MMVILLFVFLTVFLFIALFRKSWRGDFFLADRKAGAVQVASSLLATCLGGSAIFGMAARAYELGWSAFWWLGCGSIGLILLGCGWSRIMRNNPRTRTLPSWLAETYGPVPRLKASLLIVVMWIGVIAAQLVAAGSIVQTLTGGSLPASVIIIGVFTGIYVIVGGQASVLRTDVLQLGLVVIALVLLLGFLSGNELNFLSTSPKLVDFAMPFKHFIPLLVVVGGMYVVGPDMCSRVLTAKSDSAARRGAVGAGIGLALFALLITFLGMIATDPSLEPPEQSSQVLSLLVQQNLPSMLAVTVNLGFLAALISSADTCLLTAASVLGVDIFSTFFKVKGKETFYARILVPMIMLPAILLAIYNPKIIENIMLSYAVYAGGLLVPLLLLRCNRLAADISRPVMSLAILAGGLLPLILLLTGSIAIDDGTLRLAVAGTYGVLACLGVLVTGFVWETYVRLRRSKF